MPPRTGRPIKGESKRDKSLQLRMSEQELNLLDECAARLKASRTDVVNKGIQLVKSELDKK
jgi:Fe-S cluster assembly ATPase SufC